MLKRGFFVNTITIFLFFFSCGHLSAQPDSLQVTVLDAVGFDIRYEDGFTFIQFKEISENGSLVDVKELLVLEKGKPVPEIFSSVEVVFVPIEKIVTSSTTHLSLLSALSANDLLIGHGDKVVWDKEIYEKLDSGTIATVGSSVSLNTELMLNLKPDVYMAVANDDSNLNSHAILAESGINIIYNAEYLEPSLLGRAEWIKVMGLLLGKIEQANSIYNGIRERYLSLADLTANFTEKPLIFPNTPFRGTWYVPGGKSYVAQLINDAGGDYPWKDEESSGSIVVSLEVMLEIGMNADIWLNPSVSSPLLAEIRAVDSRLETLRPFNNGEVYNYTNRISESSANDYWESGVMYPDKILADMIKIFHPELLSNYQLFYYQQLK